VYQLHHGDCLDILPTLPAQSVDAVIADIPSGVTACAWDSVIPLEDMWREIKRVLKPRGACVLLGLTQPFTSVVVMSNPKWFRYDWVWDKKNPVGYLDAKRKPMRRHESIAVFCEARTPYYPIMRKGVMRVKGGMNKESAVYGKHASTASVNDEYYPTSILEITNANRTEKVHPTQKPLALLEYLVKTYTNEGNTVLDFCAGSGTTGAACGNLNRAFIGIEKYPLLDRPIDAKRNPDYFRIASERIAAAYAPLAAMEAAS